MRKKYLDWIVLAVVAASSYAYFFLLPDRFRGGLSSNQGVLIFCIVAIAVMLWSSRGKSGFAKAIRKYGGGVGTRRAGLWGAILIAVSVIGLSIFLFSEKLAWAIFPAIVIHLIGWILVIFYVIKRILTALLNLYNREDNENRV